MLASLRRFGSERSRSPCVEYPRRVRLNGMLQSADLAPWKKRMRLVLSWAATIAVIAFYVPIASTVFEATKKADLVWGSLLLGPPFCALCAALTLAFIGDTKKANPIARMWWAILLGAGLLGWPASCGTGVLLTLRSRDLFSP